MARSPAYLANRVDGNPVVRPERGERLLGHLLAVLQVGLATLFIHWRAIGSGGNQVWDQILQLESAPLGSIGIFSQAHGLRYALVTWTVFAPAEYFGGDADRWFGFAVAVSIVSTAFLVRAAASEMVGRRLPGWGFVIMSFWIVLSFFMNGRLAYGFLGHAIAVWALVRWAKGRAPLAVVAPLLAIGVVLASVSSGQLLALVGSSSVCLILVVPRTNHGRAMRAKARALVLVGLALLSPMIANLVATNLNFYGGGFGSIFKMLTHGWGGFAVPAGPVGAILFPATAAVWGIVLLIVARRAASRRPDHLVLLLIVLSSVVIGIYGFSTLLSGLPAAMVLALDRSRTLMGRSVLR